MTFRGNDDPGQGSALDALDHRPEAPDGRQRHHLHRCTCSCTCTATSRPSPATTPTTSTPTTCARSASRCCRTSGLLWVLRVVLLAGAGRARLRRRRPVAPGRQARTVKYQVKSNRGSSFSSRWMRWGGVDAAALPRLAPAELHCRQGQRRRWRHQRPVQPAGRLLRRLVADAHLPRRDGRAGPAPAPRHVERRADPRHDQHRRGAPQRQDRRLGARRRHRRRLLARPDRRPRRRHLRSKDRTHGRMPDSTPRPTPQRARRSERSDDARRLLHARRARSSTRRPPPARSRSAGPPASSRPGWSTPPTAASCR